METTSQPSIARYGISYFTIACSGWQEGALPGLPVQSGSTLIHIAEAGPAMTEDRVRACDWNGTAAGAPRRYPGKEVFHAVLTRRIIS
jgi:hypothetical protein